MVDDDDDDDDDVDDEDAIHRLLLFFSGVKSQIVPPVNIPIPTKIGSKLGGEFAENPPKWIPWVLTTTAILGPFLNKRALF